MTATSDPLTRLRCLELAAQFTKIPFHAVGLAEVFEQFVLGSSATVVTPLLEAAEAAADIAAFGVTSSQQQEPRR